MARLKLLPDAKKYLLLFHNLYLTASASLLPGLNLATVLAGICIFSPVRGFLDSRAERSAVENVPNPTNVTLSPSAKASVMLMSTLFKDFSAAALLISAASAIDSTNSFLFTLPPLFYIFPKNLGRNPVGTAESMHTAALNRIKSILSTSIKVKKNFLRSHIVEQNADCIQL